MPWFKVDDTLAFHPKVMQAGNAAMGLWVRAGAYCAAHLTDGRLTAAMIPPLGGRLRDAKRLVECGLWGETGDGFEFVGWAEFQPTKAQVTAERKATATRVANWREGQRNAVTDTVTNGVSTPAPSRPDPTRTPKGVPRDRADAPIPSDWQPTPEHGERASSSGLDLDREAAKFRAHADEKGRRAKNWNAAFTRWLINAAEYAQRDAARPTPRDRHADNLAVVRSIAIRDGVIPPDDMLQIGAV